MPGGQSLVIILERDKTGMIYDKEWSEKWKNWAKFVIFLNLRKKRSIRRYFTGFLIICIKSAKILTVLTFYDRTSKPNLTQ